VRIPGLRRIDVQVIRRLVHDQDVGPIEQKLGHRDAGAFAAAEHFDGLVDVVAGGRASAARTARTSPVGDFAVAADFLGDGAFGIEIAEALVVIADVEVRAPADFAGVGVAAAEQDFQQRGLARAVGADDADALAARDFQVDVLVQSGLLS
jgi:chorismate synthase